jgi:HEAT repeat protein
VIIDLSAFKITLNFKHPNEPFEVHFNTPNRKFFCSLISLVAVEMKKLERPEYIKIDTPKRLRNLEILDKALLGDKASPSNEKRKQKCRKAWHRRLRDSEYAPLFTVLNRQKIKPSHEKSYYELNGNEGDIWAGLFRYDKEKGSWNFKFSVDDFGLDLNDVKIIYREEYNITAWNHFFSELELTIDMKKKNIDTFADAKTMVADFLTDTIENINSFFSSINPNGLDPLEFIVPFEVSGKNPVKYTVESFLGYLNQTDSYNSRHSLIENSVSNYQNRQLWSDVRDTYKKLIILGDPGIGKSTLLHFEALSLIQKNFRILNECSNYIPSVMFPVLLQLNDIAQTDKELIETICQIMEVEYPHSFHPIYNIFLKSLKNGKCVLLLDAIDEVPYKFRRELSIKINRFIRNYKCKIICTSRIVGYYEGFLNGATELELYPFSLNQIKMFLNRYSTRHNTYRSKNSISPESFIYKLSTKPHLFIFSKIPLLLSHLCSLYDNERFNQSNRRVDIYNNSIDYMLFQTKRSHLPLSDSAKSLKIKIIEEFSYFLSCQQKRIFEIDEALKFFNEFLKRNERLSNFDTAENLFTEFSDKDGIFIKLKRGGRRYILFHRTFQEFFTASHIKRILSKDFDNGIEIIKRYLWDFEWHETIVFTVGLMDDADPIIKTILEERDDVFSTLLNLVANCLSECPRAQLETVTTVIDRLLILWTKYPYESYLENSIFNLCSNNYYALEKLLDFYRDPNSVHRHHILDFIGMVYKGRYDTIFFEALESKDSALRKSAVNYICNTFENESNDILRHIVNNPDHIGFLEVINKIGKIADDKTFSMLCNTVKEQEGENKIAAIKALGERGGRESLDFLIKNFRFVHCRDNLYIIRSIVKCCKKSNMEYSKVLPFLINIIEASFPSAGLDYWANVKHRALFAVGNINYKGSYDYLKDVYYSRNYCIELRAIAMLSISKFFPNKAEFFLKDAFYSSNSWFSAQTAKFNYYPSKEKSIHINLKRLKDKNDSVREIAVEQLIGIKDPSIIEPLYKIALDEEISFASLWAIEALGQIPDKRATDALLKLLHQPLHKYYREQAAEALSKYSEQRIISSFLDIRQNKEMLIPISNLLLEMNYNDPIEVVLYYFKNCSNNEDVFKLRGLTNISCIHTFQELINIGADDLHKGLVFGKLRKLYIKLHKKNSNCIPLHFCDLQAA